MANRTRGNESSELDGSASKRMRTSLSSSNAAKLFADSEEKMELIRSKGHVKMLETRIISLERELEEKEALSERERRHHELTKNTLDSRVSSLERELSYVVDREHQLIDRASNADKQLFEEREKTESKIRKINEDKRAMEQELNEQCDRLRTENQKLHSDFMEEKRHTAQLRHECSQLGFELGSVKRQNEQLHEQVKETTEQYSRMRSANQELQDEMKRFREECSIAMAMREELLALKALKQDNAILKKQVDRYKSTSENTLLLKEQNSGLQDQVQRLQNIQQQLVDENNELKAAIAKTAESVGQPISFADLDELSRHCIDLKNENTIMDQEIQRLQEELQEKVSVIAQLESEIENRASEAELALSQKDEAIRCAETRCDELEEVVGQKDVALNQFQKNITDVLVQWTQLKEENATLLKSLSPPIGAAACQTESPAAPESLEEFRKVLEEKEARIDYLETRYGLKLDYDPATTHVIHLEENPLAIARKEYSDRVGAVDSENHKLRIRVEELERLRQRIASVTSPDEPMDEDVDVTSKVVMRLDAELVDAERKELLDKIRRLEEEKHKQKERMKEVHQNVTREYREVCTLLTGFQLKMKEGGLYVVQSIYDKERDNYFLVQKGEGNEINLLQNEYTPRWMDFVETYLMTDHSIPAFLAAVTLSLYEKEKESVSQSNLEAPSTSAASA